MCPNIRSARTAEIEAIIADDLQGDAFEERDAFPLATGVPIIRRDGESGRKIVTPAMFGLLPHWAKERKFGRSTYNARSETVAEKPSFRTAWKAAQFCLVPVVRYYEHRYFADGPVRWFIERNDAPVFTLAGLWTWWPSKTSEVKEATFTLLTLNCEEHPVLSLFHDVDDEKRSVYHVRPEEREAWLGASPDLARQMLELPPAEVLTIGAAPLPRKPRRGLGVASTDPS